MAWRILSQHRPRDLTLSPSPLLHLLPSINDRFAFMIHEANVTRNESARLRSSRPRSCREYAGLNKKYLGGNLVNDGGIACAPFAPRDNRKCIYDNAIPRGNGTSRWYQFRARRPFAGGPYRDHPVLSFPLAPRKSEHFDQFVSSRWNFGNSRAYPRSMDIIAASATEWRERYERLCATLADKWLRWRISLPSTSAILILDFMILLGRVCAFGRGIYSPLFHSLSRDPTKAAR